MKCEMKKNRFKIISYQIPHQLIKMDFVKRDCVRILDPLSFSTIEWKHWDKTESIDLIPHSDQRSHFICWYLWVNFTKVWKIPLHIFELHTFGMTDDIWDNSRGKPPPYIWRRLYCDCKSQTSDNISSRQWCGKLSTSESHWTPFFRLMVQGVFLLGLPLKVPSTEKLI